MWLLNLTKSTEREKNPSTHHNACSKDCYAFIKHAVWQNKTDIFHLRFLLYLGFFVLDADL